MGRMFKSIFTSAALWLLVAGCGSDFEPEIKGWRAFAMPGRPRVRMDINGYKSTVRLPTIDEVSYRFAQFTKAGDRIFLMQSMRKEFCTDYVIISVDTAGEEIDTVYQAPPNTALNFKLAPNDSVLLIKSYEDCAGEEAHFRYTFYNRFTRRFLPDTVIVRNARGLPIYETVWSPDSRKVIVTQWAGKRELGFVYSFDSRDTSYLDKGINFVWSPTDNNLVAYIKNYSIYTRNIQTGEEELIYEGKKKRRAARFRFDPTGEFLMIYVRSYLLNIEAGPTGRTTIRYLSMKDKSLSDEHWDDTRLDTWISR